MSYLEWMDRVKHDNKQKKKLFDIPLSESMLREDKTVMLIENGILWQILLFIKKHINKRILC